MVPSSPGPMSNYLIKIPFESQLSALKIVRKLLRAKYGESCTPPTRTLLLFQRNCEGQKRRLNKFHLSPLLWESETSCKFHRPLGQTRNHSPVCKPPILQDIGNLEQETTVTRTLTLLSPHTPLTRMGTGKAPERGDGHSSSHLHQVPQMTRGQGRACYILKSLKHILFLRISLSCTYNTRKPCLFCSQNYFQCKSKWTANCKI